MTPDQRAALEAAGIDADRLDSDPEYKVAVKLSKGIGEGASTAVLRYLVALDEARALNMDVTTLGVTLEAVDLEVLFRLFEPIRDK